MIKMLKSMLVVLAVFGLLSVASAESKFFGSVDDRWENVANWVPELPTDADIVVLRSDAVLQSETMIGSLNIGQNETIKLEVTGAESTLTIMKNSRIANDEMGNGELVVSDGAMVECYEK